MLACSCLLNTVVAEPLHLYFGKIVMLFVSSSRTNLEQFASYTLRYVAGAMAAADAYLAMSQRGVA